MENELDVIRCVGIRRMMIESIHLSKLYYHFFPTNLKYNGNEVAFNSWLYIMQCIYFGHLNGYIGACGKYILIYNNVLKYAITFFPESLCTRYFIGIVVQTYFKPGKITELCKMIEMLSLPHNFVIEKILNLESKMKTYEVCLLVKKMKKYFGKDKWNVKLTSL